MRSKSCRAPKLIAKIRPIFQKKTPPIDNWVSDRTETLHRKELLSSGRVIFAAGKLTLFC